VSTNRASDEALCDQPTGEREAHNGVMGLFASKPEDPTEWAGLPSEPLGPLNDTEHLADPPVADGLLGETPAGTAWVTIPVVPTVSEDPAGDAPTP